MYNFTKKFFHPHYPPFKRGKIPDSVDSEDMVMLPHYKNHRGRKNLRVKVRAWKPKNKTGKGILFIHGWESSMGYFHKHINHFIAQGYYVAAVDGVSHGESDYVDIISLVNMVDAIQAGCQWFREKYPIHHLTLWGHSLGGVSTTVGVGSGLIQGINRVVVEGIYANTSYIIRRYIAMMNLPEVVARYFLWMVQKIFFKTIPSTHPMSGVIHDMEQFSPDKQLPQIEVPYILLHARKDHVVEFNEFIKLSSIGSKYFWSIPLEEGNHFTTQFHSDYFKKVDAILDETEQLSS